MMFRRLFPFVSWFEHYSAAMLRADLIAGVTIALVLVPQSMAYAQLAGLPAYYGLYASFLPPLIAAAFGSSRQLATGPVAIASLMTATALEPLARAGSEAYIGYAMLMALMVGVFRFLLGFFRLGVLVNFLSHPVVNGFTNAAAIIIASSQLSKFFGVSVDEAKHHYATVWRVLLAAREYTHWGTFALGILALAIMWGLKRLSPKIPYVLIAVAIASLLSWVIGYEHNADIEVSRIESPVVQARIDAFNNVLGEIEERSEVRMKVSPTDEDENKAYTDRPKVCLSCHSSVNVTPVNPFNVTSLIHRLHDVELLNFEMEGLKEQRNAIRAELRGYQFRAVRSDGGQLRFHLKDNTPADPRSDGRTWRLKVGTKALDKAALTMIGGGEVVGVIPRGLPGFAVPPIDSSIMLKLAMMAVIIAFLGIMEAVSIAKAIATKTGQRLDYNQELMGQGLANVVGSFTHSYPVSGSFSRSALNFQVGAQTGMSSVFTTVVVVITLLFFTPALYHLPQPVLAAIVMMAVIGLVNVRGFIHAWQSQPYDGAIAIITFVCTLVFAPHLEYGIMIGVVLSLALYLVRGMKPAIAMLSKYRDTTFRNAERFGLAQCQHIAVIRFPSPLFFANVNYLEEKVLDRIASMPDLRHILIVGNGINELDASGVEMLYRLVRQLREAGYDLSMSGLNDSVLDVMRHTGLYEKIGEDHLFRNASMALEGIHAKAHVNSTEKQCPLLDVVELELPAPEHHKKRFITSEQRLFGK